MGTWLSIGGAVCVAVTAVGLVVSWRVWRKGGASRGVRAVAWSLIPLAAYLTNSVALIGRIVSAIVRFAGAFVFSPKSWAGVAVVGLVVLLFMVSGGLPLLNWRKARARRKLAKAQASESRPAVEAGGRSVPASTVLGTTPAARAKAPARTGARGSTSDDDDMSDIEEILKRRGIK